MDGSGEGMESYGLKREVVAIDPGSNIYIALVFSCYLTAFLFFFLLFLRISISSVDCLGLLSYLPRALRQL